MGGQLTVSSEVGRGSIFSFDIVAQLSQKFQVELASSKSVIALANDSFKPRILIVDDVWQSRLFVVKLLSQVGFEVQEAENGKQALNLAKTWQPHLILMDMRMPVMDGYESTRKIRSAEQNSELASIKIIALTASAFASKQAQTIAVGCDDYLRKPFKENQLFAIIQKHLEVKYIYQQLDTDHAFTKPETGEILPLTSDALKVMPEPWLQEFKLAAAELNDERLENLIQQIPIEHDYLAQSLINLVHNFQFEKLIELT